MTLHGSTTHQPPATGTHLVDEATAVAVPPDPPWVGRFQRVAGDGRYVLISETGYEWPAAPGRVRAATDAERAAFRAEAALLRHELAVAWAPSRSPR